MQPETMILGGSVLIADDHEVFRFGLVHLLRSALQAEKIYEAGNLDDALTLLARHDLELAIFDLDMPGMNGPADLARVRAARPDVRVVVLSASESRRDILGALEAGVHGYIIKSQATTALVKRLRYVLSGEIYVPALLADATLAPSVSEALAEGTLLPPALTVRQKHVLQGLVEGLSNKELALKLGVSEGTVKMHIAALLRILGAANRTHAAALGKHLLD